MDGVSEQIAVAVRAGRVLVTLTAHNRTAHPVYLPKALYQDDELIAPLFALRDAGGREIQYIGRKVKRGPITQDDYLALKPGARHANTIDITSSYDFLAGEHTYQLAYSGGYLNDITRPDVATPVRVAPVWFTLRK